MSVAVMVGLYILSSGTSVMRYHSSRSISMISIRRQCVLVCKVVLECIDLLYAFFLFLSMLVHDL